MTLTIIIYIIIIFFCRYLAIIYEWTTMDVVWRAACVAAVLSLISLLSVMAGLKIKVDIQNDRIVKGRKIPLTIDIQNRSLLPAVMVRMYIITTNELHGIKSKCKVNVPIRKWGMQRYTFDMVAGSCGNISIELKKIVIRDWLGLLRLTKRIKLVRRMPVLPPYSDRKMDEPVRNNAVYIDSENFSKDRPGEDPSEVFDIRRMKEDDSIRKVNWKISAKKDAYMVNDYSLPTGKGIIIFIDNCINADKNMETIVTDKLFYKVLDISVNLAEFDMAHDIVWFDKNTGMCDVRHIEPEDDVADVFTRLFECGIYTGKTELIRTFNLQYEGMPISHIYYVCSECNMETITAIYDGRENTIIKLSIAGVKENMLSSEEINYCEALNIEVEEY